MRSLVSRLTGRSEFVVVCLLLGLGALVLWDASRIDTGFTQRGPVGPAALPTIIGAGLIGCALLLAVDVLRGRPGKTETGDEVDTGPGIDWRTVLLLVATLVATIALIERAGWVVAGSVLFWGSLYALGSRRPLRDGAIAVAMAVATFYLFDTALGVNLPAGVLQGIL